MADRLVIAYESRHFADADWSRNADRWRASFYENGAKVFGKADITRVIPGVTPNPRQVLELDPGLLDRITRVVFAEDGELNAAISEMAPSMLLLLESVEVGEQWRGKGVGMSLAVTALRHLAIPGTVAVCYPAPIHDHGPDEPCSYDSDDPEVRRPDEEAMDKLRAAWERHGFKPIGEGVYAMAL
jgi:hypothetical protein